MHDKHEPEQEFVDRLEWQLSSEVRRRNRAAPAPRGFLSTPARVAISAVLLVAISMSFGAAAVAASYQAEDNWRRELLAARLEVRVEMARLRLELAIAEMASIDQRFDVGTATEDEVAEARLRIAAEEASLAMIELELEEVELSGQEPLGELSSPLVEGRDFVTERLRLEMWVISEQLGFAQQRLATVTDRAEAGTVASIDVDRARTAVVQGEMALDTLRRRLDIRRDFVAGEMTAVVAELRVLEAEARQRELTLMPQLDLANRELDRAQERYRLGAAGETAVHEATLTILALEAELVQAQLELEILRRQLQERQERR